MGLLDDAIREHLELKRRRGANPTEVARQEQEALGPVRREPVARGQDPGADPQAGAPFDAEEADPGAPEGPATELAAQPADEDEDPAAGGPSRAVVGEDDEEWGFDDEPEAEEPTAEGEADEDVLEETPDFLRETPEHDRAWFEQKPPRDFDFDG